MSVENISSIIDQRDKSPSTKWAIHKLRSFAVEKKFT